MDPARVRELARSVEPEEPEVRHAFSLVIRALEHRWLSLEDLGELAVAFQRSDFGGSVFQELNVEPDWSEPTRIRVSFLDEIVACARAPFGRALRELGVRVREKDPS